MIKVNDIVNVAGSGVCVVQQVPGPGTYGYTLGRLEGSRTITFVPVAATHLISPVTSDDVKRAINKNYEAIRFLQESNMHLVTYVDDNELF